MCKITISMVISILMLIIFVQISAAQVLEQDSLALVAIYNSTNGDEWTDNTNWLSDSSVSTWNGISVSIADDRVTQIKLIDNNVTGTLPPEIGDLTAMSLLNLSNNPLTGPIPSEIGSCTSLYALQIFNTGLNGNLPVEIGSLDNLNTIQLYNNELEGSIPTEIGDLDNIVWIELYNNNLTGSIPAEIGNLTGLTTLNLDRNDLSGSIPSEIGNLVNLSGLSLASNSLDGSIPAEIGKLTNLTVLQLWGNDLSGEIPVEIGNLTQLTGLTLSSNQLTGSIPTEICNLTELTDINFASNQLTGSIPDSIGKLTYLFGLYLQGNQLTGTIPTSIGKLTNLMYLYLYNNQLEGEIPDIWTDLTQLRQLQLHRNQFKGAVPLSIKSLTSLQEFYLSDNHLTDLPDLTALINLKWLYIEQNAFTFEDIEPNIGVPSSSFVYAPQDSVGVPVDTTVETGFELVLVTKVGGSSNVYHWYKNTIPIDGANDSILIINPVVFNDAGTYSCQITNNVATALTLYHQPFYVNVKQSMFETDSLALVDLYTSTNGGNWTTNTNWLSAVALENWHGVTVENNRVVSLDLQENNMNGSVPSSLGNLSALTFLSLRNNNLSGSLPDEIGNMTEMTDLDFAFNNLSGAVPETLGNLSKLVALFLDFNAFEGSIPLSLGRLKNLSAIYLGGNNLTGSIPDTLCTLTNLTVFHFQNNNLTGPVPASLINLDQLETIDLEQNHLTDFPDISDNIPPLQHLRLNNNNFVFEDIEPYIDASLTTLTYLDQDSVGTGMDTTITEGDDLMFAVITGGSANLYQWKKDDVDIVGAENSTFTISSAELSDAGSYVCEITSSIVPDLTLYSRPVNVTVKKSTDLTENVSDIPKEYALYQNYPNPFNPVTSIRYALPVKSDVDITLYNLLGQKICTIISGKQEAGYHIVQFNGIDLSSGVYFYKISTNNFSQIKKMILIK